MPLIALQYNEVVLDIYLNSFQDYISNHENIPETYNPLQNMEIWVEYIYLDTDERRRFAQITHEYLIEQVQINQFDLITGPNYLDLKFNNTVKEVIFAPHWNNVNDIGSIPGLGNNNTEVSFSINTNDFFNSNRSLTYFTRNQIWDKHTGNTNFFGDGSGYITYKDETLANQKYTQDSKVQYYDQIAIIPFCLRPEDHQPTGTMNFSAIENCRLTLEKMCPPLNQKSDRLSISYNETRTLNVYAVSYNMFRIMSGVGKLAYIV